MNQTQIWGAQKVGFAYRFIAMQLANQVDRQLIKRKMRQKIAKRFMTMVIAIALVASINMPQVTAQELPSDLHEAIDFRSSLRLDTSNYSLLVIEENKIEIVPGQSKAQIEAEELAAREAAVRRARDRSLPLVNVAVLQTTIVRVSIEESHAMAQAAAVKAGIPDYWKYLAAIWQVESGKAVYSCIVSSADGQAVGPMQFMPGTFRGYKPTPDANICDANDALHAAANLLKHNGLVNNVDGAIYRYNHSMAYVAKVKRIAASIN